MKTVNTEEPVLIFLHSFITTTAFRSSFILFLVQDRVHEHIP